MITNFIQNISPTEIAIIVLIFVVIFGRKFMMGLGKASGETLKEIKNISKNITNAVEGNETENEKKEVSK